MLSRRLDLRSEEGFTLIEMTATIAVLSILVAMFATLLTVTVTRSGRQQEQSTLQTEMRAAVDSFASDLRQALCNNQTPPITTATATQIVFTTPDRQTPYHLRQVSYQVTGGTLQRQSVSSTNTGGPPWTLPALSTGPVETLVGSITNASPYFTYRDASDAVTSTLASIARVDIALTTTPKASSGDATTGYSQTVNLRSPTCS